MSDNYTGDPNSAWGVLQGVRPGKLAHKLLDSGLTPKELEDILEQQYHLDEINACLLKDIALTEKRLLPDATRYQDAAIYVGIPYCPSRCSYCSFPAGIIPADEAQQQAFLDVLERDLQDAVRIVQERGFNLLSVYVGGGTPTSFSDKVFAHFMDMLHRNIRIDMLKEFTVEAGRPDCFSAFKLAAMEDIGVTRVSVNPQTFKEETLQLIGRNHTIADFYRAYEMVRNSKIACVNMDMIIGLPGETLADITRSIDTAFSLQPDNLTVHTLALKKSAPMFYAHDDVVLTEQEAEAAVNGTMAKARELNLLPYYVYRQHYMLGHLANIGYAVPGTESLYNVQMMEERHPVIGVGPSSSSKMPLLDGHHLNRLNMPKNVAVYRDTLEALCAKRRAVFAPEEGPVLGNDVAI